ncbi:MAG: hypothetical protein WBO55_14080 [Rhizobiaceae bacterium]
MSYQVFIRRLDGSVILTKEVEALAESDPDLRCEAPHGAPQDDLLLSWQGGGETRPTTFLLSGGELQCTSTPSDGALEKSQQIARSLDARLFGEEGEDLSEADLSPRKPSTRAALGCLATMLALATLLVWWWLRG